MFEHLTKLQPFTGKEKCTRKASAILPHAANHKAVVSCRTARGSNVYLCASCADYVNAESWLIRMGVVSPSAAAIRTAARLLSASAGYPPPSAAEHRAREEWYHLRDFEKRALARRVKMLFVARDACPDPECLQRGGEHSQSCGLTYGEAFSERVKVDVG